MIKIRKGNTRVVFIILNTLVVKFPNPRIDWIKNSLKQWRNPRTLLKVMLTGIYDAMLHGITANISEGLLYRQSIQIYERVAYLTPVFSIGICNFQFYEGEDSPSKKEMDNLYSSLSKEARDFLDKSDMHDKSHHNWRKTSKGLRLIDYATSPLCTEWGLFLISSGDELNKATAK